MIVGCLGYLVMGCVAAGDELRPLLAAIQAVETSGIRAPSQAVGDDGRSIGPYQISKAYWMDSRIKGAWKHCRGQAYSETVMLAYWKRHCPVALRQRNFEVLARIHNGGPRGQSKQATILYWQKVRRALPRRPWTASSNRALGLNQQPRWVTWYGFGLFEARKAGNRSRSGFITPSPDGSGLG